jgi:hypothetical protein
MTWISNGRSSGGGGGVVVVDGPILRSNSSRSTVLSKEQYESVKTLLQTNKEVAHHPEVKKQARLVYRLLQKLSNRCIATNTCSEDDNDVKDPVLLLVDDLIQNNSIETIEKEESSQTKDCALDEEKEHSDAFSSEGAVKPTNNPVPVPVPKEEVVASAASESKALTKDSSCVSNQEDFNAGAIFCSLLPLCFPRSQDADTTAAADDNVDLSEPQPLAVTPAPGLVFRVNDAPLETRDDKELMNPNAFDAGRSCQEREQGLPRSMPDPDMEDVDEDLQIKLGRGGPYDNLLRILLSLEMIEGDETVAGVFARPELSDSSSHDDRQQTRTE